MTLYLCSAREYVDDDSVKSEDFNEIIELFKPTFLPNSKSSSCMREPPREMFEWHFVSESHPLCAATLLVQTYFSNNTCWGSRSNDYVVDVVWEELNDNPRQQTMFGLKRLVKGVSNGL